VSISPGLNVRTQEKVAKESFFTVGVAKELALRARIVWIEGDLIEVPPQPARPVGTGPANPRYRSKR